MVCREIANISADALDKPRIKSIDCSTGRYEVDSSREAAVYRRDRDATRRDCISDNIARIYIYWAETGRSQIHDARISC
tara:strand:- start:8428 stop:8664 length:237 start_codon:yes stop_codon:yes gene_type:complete